MRSLVLVLVLAGCAGSAIRDKTAITGDVIGKARENGAQRCAPVELAMAESHNEFANHALDEGNYFEARREASVAETNAQQAFEKSPKEKCVDVGDFDHDGILDNVDKCPRVPEDLDGFEDTDGCPDEDNDKDGIADKIDACPNDPEDKDNFEDDDGCPDLDNDKDGIPDKTDKCPNEPGVPPDGCPKKYTNVVVTQTKIEIKQTVFFATNKATIKPMSFGLLTEVAQAMKDNPTIKVDVEGHTDSQGNDAFNLKLSQKRAESVKKFLVSKGVPSDRMVPKGYGENVPLADNRTDTGRAQNRRVEFVITSR